MSMRGTTHRDSHGSLVINRTSSWVISNFLVLAALFQMDGDCSVTMSEAHMLIGGCNAVQRSARASSKYGCEGSSFLDGNGRQKMICMAVRYGTGTKHSSIDSL